MGGEDNLNVYSHSLSLSHTHTHFHSALLLTYTPRMWAGSIVTALHHSTLRVRDTQNTHTHTIDHSRCFFNLPHFIHDAVNDDIARKEGRYEVHLTLEGRDGQH